MSKKTFDIIIMFLILLPNIIFCYLGLQDLTLEYNLMILFCSLSFAIIIYIASIYNMKDDKEFTNFGLYTVLVLPYVNIIVAFAIVFTILSIQVIESLSKFRKRLK